MGEILPGDLLQFLGAVAEHLLQRAVGLEDPPSKSSTAMPVPAPSKMARNRDSLSRRDNFGAAVSGSGCSTSRNARWMAGTQFRQITFRNIIRCPLPHEIHHFSSPMVPEMQMKGMSEYFSRANRSASGPLNVGSE